MKAYEARKKANAVAETLAIEEQQKREKMAIEQYKKIMGEIDQHASQGQSSLFWNTKEDYFCNRAIQNRLTRDGFACSLGHFDEIKVKWDTAIKGTKAYAMKCKTIKVQYAMAQDAVTQSVINHGGVRCIYSGDLLREVRKMLYEDGYTIKSFVAWHDQRHYYIISWGDDVK